MNDKKIRAKFLKIFDKLKPIYHFANALILFERLSLNMNTWNIILETFLSK